MKALIIVAHGSRRPNSNKEIKKLADEVALRVCGDFDLVDCAFLESAAPSIDNGIDDLIERGARSIVIVPYFLSCDTHVTSDIPLIVEAVRHTYPGIDIVTTDYLGQLSLMTDVVTSLALGA